jgi:hypothetical protein
VATDGRNTEGAVNDVEAEYGSTVGVIDDRKVHIVENSSNTRDG